MRNTKIMKKVVAVTTALVMAGSVAPLSGSVNAQGKTANAHQMVEDIFDQVGLKVPAQLEGKTKTVSADSDFGSDPAVPVENASDQADREQAPATGQDKQADPQPAPAETDAAQTQHQAAPAETDADRSDSQAAPARTSTGDSQPEASSGQPSVSFGDKVIDTGKKYLGTPYQFGAQSGNTNRFDCSSFTQYVFKQHGVKLPRGARDQGKVGQQVSRSQLQKGDLVFFKLKKTNGKIGHVGIYAGDGKVLHTWGRGGVRIDSMNVAWLDWGFLYGTRARP